MRAFLVVLLFVVFALVARWYYVCQWRNMCKEAGSLQFERFHDLRFIDDTLVVLEGYDHFAFDTSSVVPILNDNNKTFLDSVAAYLAQNQDRKLKIVGLYRPSEEGLSYRFLENLGLARAAELRKLLVRRGISEARINIDHGKAPSEGLGRPVRFDAYLPEDSEYLPEAFTFQNISFSHDNFEFGSAEFKPGLAFVAYADSVKIFLEQNVAFQLEIIGHTDNVDTDEFNYGLGLRRAESAEKYFWELGVPKDKIETASRGEQQPVASNATSVGRSKNRRVNFLLKESS